MDSTFINSENSKTSDPHMLLLNLSNKINFKRKKNVVSTKTTTLKYQLQHGMKNLIY